MCPGSKESIPGALRVKIVKDPSRSETWLNYIGDAIRYLKNDFNPSECDVGWHHAAKSLEEAHRDPKTARHATKALFVFLDGAKRIVEPDSARRRSVRATLGASDEASCFR